MKNIKEEIRVKFPVKKRTDVFHLKLFLILLRAIFV